MKPSSLGDIVHTLPAVAELKRHWPASRIRWIANTEWLPLLEGNPHLEETIEFPRRNFRGVAGVFRIAPWAQALSARMQADLVLDFQGLLRSALIARLCRGKDARVLGLSDAREGARFFYDAAADTSGIAHAVDRYLALVRLATGAPAPAPADLVWPMPAGTAVAAVDATPFVLLHPFSRGAGKSLSVEDVTVLCRAMEPMRVIVAGRAEVQLPTMANVVDLLNRTSIAELIWLLRRAAFVVSVDSGPMHIAAALTPELVSIHTWSDPDKVGPYRPGAWIWRHGTLTQRGSSAHPQSAPDLAALATWVKTRLR